MIKDTPKITHLKRNNDIKILIVVTIFLLIFGILAVGSCSHMVDLTAPYSCIKKHLINIFIGFISCIVASFINYKKYQGKNLLLFIFTTILLILPIFFPAHKGAHRWFPIPMIVLSFQFQPSEIAKLVMVIIMSDFISRNKPYINTWEKNLFPVIYVSVFCSLIIFLQRDLGSTALIFCLWFALLLIAKIDTKRFIIICLIALLGLTVFIAKEPYRRTRVITHFKPVIQCLSGKKQNADETKKAIKESK
ncbi:MAG: FtsW/RodA/SpoVE family cell cycle protein, partial [Elusimicrobia bacterium]|nr:FtsW/RodA/SpoVE family cell cycle protein [Elusimicrobiota bacterium]